jgi:hypothetical protein
MNIRILTFALGAVAGINKCGQGSCLCTGTFCADLIDAGYCDDFHCAPGQCIRIFWPAPSGRTPGGEELPSHGVAR